MNAKEFAHELEKAASFIRKQQAEIEALKGGFFDWSGFKKLTDEEIMKLYDQDDLYNIDEGQMYLKPIEFARAILRKAQEK